MNNWYATYINGLTVALNSLNELNRLATPSGNDKADLMRAIRHVEQAMLCAIVARNAETENTPSAPNTTATQ